MTDHNPQCENGYTAIANELLEALCRTRVSGESMQIFLTILRKTYGYKKKMDKIPLSQFSGMTGMKKPAVVRALRNLHGMGFIIKVDNGKNIKYGINKHYSTWEPLSKRATTFEPVSSLKKFCYICNFDKALEKHHITPRAEGGSNKSENLIVLCPNCHALVHKKEFAREALIIKKANVESVTNIDNVILAKKVIEGEKPLSKTVHSKENIKTIKEKTKENTLSSSADEAVAEGEDFYLTKKKRKLTGKRLETFNSFWEAFGYKAGKAEAADAWMDIPTLTTGIVSAIIAAANAECLARSDIVARGKTPKMAQGWLSGRRWEDERQQLAPLAKKQAFKGVSDDFKKTFYESGGEADGGLR